MFNIRGMVKLCRKDIQPFPPCEDTMRNLQAGKGPSPYQAVTLISDFHPQNLSHASHSTKNGGVSNSSAEMLKELGVPTAFRETNVIRLLKKKSF